MRIVPPHIFSTYNHTKFIVERFPHSNIQRYILISMMLMNVFNSPYFFVCISVIPVHIYYFIFCFEFHYPITDIIVNYPYLLFLRSRKTNAKCCNKKGKNHSGIILKQLVRSVARNIVWSRTSDIFLRFANILALPTFCIGDVKELKHLLENIKM